MKIFHVYTDNGKRYLGTVQAETLMDAQNYVDRALIMLCTVEERGPDERETI